MSTIQEIFRKFYPMYVEKYRPSKGQAKAARAIMNCRTATLGGHAYGCHNCGHTQVSYNSCRNRHCPSCQGVTKEVWIDKRKKDILNAPYFHVVFTMPEQLHMLIYHNQKLLYDLMYKAVSETLSELAQDPKYLGAQIGFFSVLHTWGQNLHYHPHIHTVVLAGGLNKLNRWCNSSHKFFIPVKVLSKKFRGKYLYFLKQYYEQNRLQFYNEAKSYEDPKQFQRLIDKCYSINWYSYTKRTFSGPLAVVQYLGRYTHRIAISNQRIISIGKDTVTFRAKNYRDNSRKNTITMRGVEFIRRFLMHILPKGLVKIRHYGILANRNKKTKLRICRILTQSRVYKPAFEGLSTIEIVSKLIGKDITLCPSCKKAHLVAAVSDGLP
jgi:hypothetical protein